MSSNSKPLLKTIEGIDIFIDPETGRFEAKIGGKVLKKRALRDIEKEIEDRLGAIRAYELSSHEAGRPRAVEVSRFEGDRARLKGDRLAGRYDTFYILDMESLAKIESLCEAKRKIEEEYQAIIESLVRLDPKNFSEIRERQRSQK